MIGNGDDVRQAIGDDGAGNADPPVQTTTAPGVTMLRPDQVKVMEDYNLEQAAFLADKLKERGPGVFKDLFDDIDKRLDKMEKRLQGPQSPVEIIQAISNLQHLASSGDRAFACEMLKLWCAAPRTG